VVLAGLEETAVEEVVAVVATTTPVKVLVV
jgi:hypothetical protein